MTGKKQTIDDFFERLAVLCLELSRVELELEMVAEVQETVARDYRSRDNIKRASETKGESIGYGESLKRIYEKFPEVEKYIKREMQIKRKPN